MLIKPIAKPGTYQLRLTVDGQSQTEAFELKINPNEAYTREQTEAITRFALDRGLWVLTDEIYRDLVYEGAEHVSPLSVAGGEGADSPNPPPDR